MKYHFSLLFFFWGHLCLLFLWWRSETLSFSHNKRRRGKTSKAVPCFAPSLRRSHRNQLRSGGFREVMRSSLPVGSSICSLNNIFYFVCLVRALCRSTSACQEIARMNAVFCKDFPIWFKLKGVKPLSRIKQSSLAVIQQEDFGTIEKKQRDNLPN